MKKMISAALVAAFALPAISAPAVAFAQSHHDRRDDRYDRRDDRRDDRHDRREDRRDHRDYRDDRYDRGYRWGDNDWERYRRSNRVVFARGTWRAPFRYTAFRPGVRIGAVYFGPRYVVADPWRYHLPPAGRGLVWVRHYNDVLLVDTRRGVVIRVHRGFFW
ncbi:MAG: RcnB family protein [Pseudomonadota bacterium]